MCESFFRRTKAGKERTLIQRCWNVCTVDVSFTLFRGKLGYLRGETRSCESVRKGEKAAQSIGKSEIPAKNLCFCSYFYFTPPLFPRKVGLEMAEGQLETVIPLMSESQSNKIFKIKCPNQYWRVGKLPSIEYTREVEAARPFFSFAHKTLWIRNWHGLKRNPS